MTADSNSSGIRAGDKHMSDVKRLQEIRERARQKIMNGAVTEDYQDHHKITVGLKPSRHGPFHHHRIPGIDIVINYNHKLRSNPFG